MLDAAPVVRGKYVRETDVRAFLSGETFVRVDTCPGIFVRVDMYPGRHLSGYVSSGLVKCWGTHLRVRSFW